MRMQCCGVEWRVKGSAPNCGGLSGLSHSEKPARSVFAEADRFIHHVLWQHPHVTYCFADLALHLGNYDRAARMLNDSLLRAPGFLSNISNREFSITRLLIVGKLACAKGDYEEAARLFGRLKHCDSSLAICSSRFLWSNIKSL